MKAICFCNSNVSWGGGEQWTYEVALAMSVKGWRVFVVCNPSGALYAKLRACERITAIGISLGGLSLLNLFLPLRLKALFRKEKIHAVLLHTPRDLWNIGPAAHRAGVEHVIYRRSSSMPIRRSWFTRKLFKRVVTKLIVNSETTGKIMLLENPSLLLKERMRLVPNGIDAVAFDVEYARAEPLDLGRKALAFSPDIVLGAVGVSDGQCSQNCLIHLARGLVEAGVSPLLVVVGEDRDLMGLRALAESLEVQKYVFFTAPAAGRTPFWKAIDCFVLTALWDGFDFVLGEAMLAQKPVLAFAISNIPDIVHDHVNGRLFAMPCQDDSGKPDLSYMVEGVKALAVNPEIREKIGLAGRSFALSKFSLEASVLALENLIWDEPEEEREEAAGSNTA